MLRLARALLAVAVAVSAVPPLYAQVASLPLPAPPPSSTRVLAGHLADRLVAPPHRPGPSVRFAISVDFPSPPPGGDAKRVSDFVADALEAALRAETAMGPRVAPREASVRFEITLTTRQGHIEATARRRRMPGTVWERLREPLGRVISTAVASVPIDLEVRVLLNVGRRQVRFDRLEPVQVTRGCHRQLLAQPILDLVAADLDGDGTQELAALQPDRVLILAWTTGGFSKLTATRSLADLPPNSARVRDPLGRLLVLTRRDGTRRLVAASTNFAHPAVLELSAGKLIPQPQAASEWGWPLYGLGADAVVTGVWPRGVDVLFGPASRQVLGSSARAVVGTLQPVYEVRAFAPPYHGSPPWNPCLLTITATHQLFARCASAPKTVVKMGRHGLAAAVADMDLDGRPEVIATDPAVGASSDTLTLYILERANRARKLRRWPVAGSITALAAGDFDRDGHDEYVVAAWRRSRGKLFLIPPVIR